MQAKVLKDFPLSTDGVTVADVKKDAVVDVPDDLFEGLKAAGYIEAVPAAAVDGAAKKKPGAKE